MTTDDLVKLLTDRDIDPDAITVQGQVVTATVEPLAIRLTLAGAGPHVEAMVTIKAAQGDRGTVLVAYDYGLAPRWALSRALDLAHSRLAHAAKRCETLKAGLR